MNYVKKYWLPALIVLLIIISVIISRETKPDTGITIDDSMSGRQCFAYEQTIPASEQLPESVNREYIELAIDNDGLVSGIHMISSPRNAIEKTSQLVGVTDGQFVNVIVSTVNEPEKQELYKIQNDILYVGYQTVDVPQYQNENGVFMYEDLNQIQFESNDFFLSRVECDNNN